MPRGPFAPFLHYVRSRRRAADADAELLARFAADRDDDAFAELVRRHGPLVWGVARQVLGHDQDAEDAFQATFVLLARKAGSIRSAAAVAGWLHGTAWRVAAKARTRANVRRERERSVPPRPNGDPATDVALRELQALLHAEVAALPAKYRTPFVLCVLEGRGRTEVARSLGWNEGTLSTRLAWARQRLRSRLLRRGVDVGAALAAVEVTRGAVPAALASSAVTAARTGIVSAAVTALAHGGFMTTKYAPLVTLGLVVSVIAIGSAGLMGSDPPVGRTPKAKETARADDPPLPKTPTGIVTVIGTATGADGKPVAGATVVLLHHTDFSYRASKFGGTATTDEHGRYEFRNVAVPLRTRPNDGAVFLQVAAMALRQPFAWSPEAVVQAKPDPKAAGPAGERRLVADRQTLNLTFGPSAPFRGRVVDETGQPTAGVKVSLLQLDRLRGAGKDQTSFYVDLAVPDSQRSTTTDRSGRFRLDGAPRDCFATLAVRHPDYAEARIYAMTDGAESEGAPSTFWGEIDLTLFKPRTIAVRVIDALTGKPVPRATAIAVSQSRVQYRSEMETDSLGRAALRIPPGDCNLTVNGPRGGEFVSQQETFTVNTTAEQPREVPLVHGCKLRVEAVDAKTGQPLAGVRFSCETPNSGGGRWIDGDSDTATDEQGLSKLLFHPGKPLIVAELAGYETVKGPTEPIELPAGGEVKLRFELRKNGAPSVPPPGGPR
jgi:RNA polymerase sigma factor (sigma-70 family)